MSRQPNCTDERLIAMLLGYFVVGPVMMTAVFAIGLLLGFWK